MGLPCRLGAKARGGRACVLGRCSLPTPSPTKMEAQQVPSSLGLQCTSGHKDDSRGADPFRMSATLSAIGTCTCLGGVLPRRARTVPPWLASRDPSRSPSLRWSSTGPWSSRREGASANEVPRHSLPLRMAVDRPQGAPVDRGRGTCLPAVAHGGPRWCGCAAWRAVSQELAGRAAGLDPRRSALE